jgi:hypothetical protein
LVVTLLLSEGRQGTACLPEFFSYTRAWHELPSCLFISGQQAQARDRAVVASHPAASFKARLFVLSVAIRQWILTDNSHLHTFRFFGGNSAWVI